jgi:hypothetical protein
MMHDLPGTFVVNGHTDAAAGRAPMSHDIPGTFMVNGHTDARPADTDASPADTDARPAAPRTRFVRTQRWSSAAFSLTPTSVCQLTPPRHYARVSMFISPDFGGWYH